MIPCHDYEVSGGFETQVNPQCVQNKMKQSDF